MLLDLAISERPPSRALGTNFDSLVRKLVKKKEEEEWKAKLEKRSKLRLYKKLKSRLVLEDYVVELDREKEGS